MHETSRPGPDDEEQPSGYAFYRGINAALHKAAIEGGSAVVAIPGGSFTFEPGGICPPEDGPEADAPTTGPINSRMTIAGQLDTGEMAFLTFQTGEGSANVAVSPIDSPA